MSKTALITGATGFIGNHICKKLFDNKYQVIAIGTKGENKPFCHNFYQLNLDGIPWNSLPEKIDVCFHQAANNDTTDMDSANMVFSNLTAPANLFERLYDEKKCTKFIYASSCSIYGNQPIPYKENETKAEPLNPYAKSKLLFEQFAKKFSENKEVTTVGLRYSNVYGPNEKHKGKRASMISQLLEKMLLNEKPKLFKFGEQLRDWVYVDDVVEANMLALNCETSDIFNVGYGESTSFKEIVSIINDELKTDLDIDFVDCPFLDAYQNHTKVDLEKSKSTLKYFPKYCPRKGISKLIQLMKKATK